MKIDLMTEIAGIRFQNPVAVASDTFGSKDEYAQYLNYNRLGAIVTKTVTRKPRAGNRMPRIWETPSGMLNSIGLQNKGIDDFLDPVNPQPAGWYFAGITNSGTRIRDAISTTGQSARRKDRGSRYSAAL